MNSDRPKGWTVEQFDKVAELAAYAYSCHAELVRHGAHDNAVAMPAQIVRLAALFKMPTWDLIEHGTKVGSR